MIAVVALALAQPAAIVGDPLLDIGYGPDGVLWALTHAGATPYEGGPLVKGVTHLLADGHDPLVMAVGAELRLVGEHTETVMLGAPAEGIWRAGDRGVFVLAGGLLEHIGTDGLVVGQVVVPGEVDQVVGPDASGAVWVVGDEVSWRWELGGLRPATAPAGLWSPTGTQRLMGALVLGGPREVDVRRPLGAVAWSADDRWLVGRGHDNDEVGRTQLVRVDLKSGAVTQGLLRSYDFGTNLALAPDGSEVAWLLGGRVWQSKVGAEEVASRWPRALPGGVPQRLLESTGSPTARVTWRSGSDASHLYRVGHEPTVLTVPADGNLEERPYWSYPGVAIDPAERWVAMRFASGSLGVVGADGALRWSAAADVDAVSGPHVAFDVRFPETREPSWSGCGNHDPEQAAHPHPSPDGALVVAAGRAGAWPDSVVQVWRAETGEVVHRFVFDAPTSVLGFRGDGRLVVHAHRTVFALSVDTPMGEPEVVADGVFGASLVDGDVATSTSSW